LRRLRARPAPSPPDLRPALLAVIGLMFLLLPFLLLTTSIRKLAGLDLELAQDRGDLAPLPPGVVESLEVWLRGDELRVRAAVRTLDVNAATGDATWSELQLPGRDGELDLAGLQLELARLRRLDPARQRIELRPTDGTPTSLVVAVADALRGSAEQELFSQVVLGGQAQPAQEARPDQDALPAQETQP